MAACSGPAGDQMGGADGGGQRGGPRRRRAGRPQVLAEGWQGGLAGRAGRVRRMAVGAVAECTSMIGLPCPYSRYRMAAASASPASHALISWADPGIGAADSMADQPASPASPA